MAVKEKIRVRLKSYDHKLIDTAAEKIVDVAKRNGATVSGPIPLPTEKEIVTILRAVHKYKDSREQFERRTHKRLIDVVKPSPKTVEALMSLELFFWRLFIAAISMMIARFRPGRTGMRIDGI